MQALICPNNLQNEYGSDTYESEKQLHMMRIIWQFKQERMIVSTDDNIMCGTNQKKHHNEIISKGQEQLIIRELEAQLINSIC